MNAENADKKREWGRRGMTKRKAIAVYFFVVLIRVYLRSSAANSSSLLFGALAYAG
jgi:hypothetical protein